MTTSIEEIRQRLENAKAHYEGTDPEAFSLAVDNFVKSLRERYGEQVPTLEVARLLRELRVPAAATASALPKTEPAPESQGAPSAGATGVDGEKTPDGVRFEWMPGGFLLRVSCGSLIAGAPWAVFAGTIAALPFILWGDLIRGVWTDQGMSFWLTSTFLAIWAGVVLYVVATAAVGLFGEIRIAQDGDGGRIFTGIGRVGWTHHLLWSEFSGVAERDVDSPSSGRGSHTSRFVGLNGPSKRYKFGSALTDQQRVFVIAFLRRHVFGSSGMPASAPAPAPAARAAMTPDFISGSLNPERKTFVSKTMGGGKTTAIENVRQALEQAKADYQGQDREGFHRAMDEFVASLRAQYGEQMPVADAMRRLEQLSRSTGAEIHFHSDGHPAPGSDVADPRKVFGACTGYGFQRNGPVERRQPAVISNGQAKQIGIRDHLVPADHRWPEQ
jgi:hypothetical protein